MSLRAKTDPAQEELPLSSIAAHTLFPGRTTLYVTEVSRALGMAENQVIDLIESGELEAVNIASKLQAEGHSGGSKTTRRYWRVPVSAYDVFIARRKATATPL